MIGMTALALATAAAGVAAPTSAPAAYGLTVIFDYGDRGGYVGCPAMGADGVVAFERIRGGTSQVVRGDEDGLTVIAKEGRRDVVDFGGVALNDAGQVAIIAELSDDEYVVLRGDGDDLDLMATTVGTVLGRIYGQPSINEQGALAFAALRDDGRSGVYTVDEPGGTPQPWYLEEAAIGGVYSADMAGASVVFRTGEPTFAAYRSDAPGHVVELADDDGEYTEPSITTRKRVAVVGLDTTDFVGRIAVGRRAPLPTYYDSEDSGLDLQYAVTSINRSGTVAFSADYVDAIGSTGVYIGKQARPVLQPDDEIKDETVHYTSFCKDGLNDAGQVAIAVAIDTGTTMIVRADPRGLTRP